MRKSNYIAAAMAFAALVGCQKELVPVVSSEKAADADLSLRPVLASSELTLGGPETRVSLVEGGYSWKWDENDQVGAVLTDQINDKSVTLYVQLEDGSYLSEAWSYSDYLKGTKTYGSEEYAFAEVLKKVGEEYVPATSQDFYEITDEQVWTNYPYTREGSIFTTPAKLVEGHYMFYAPYSEMNTTRGPLVATLPVIQKATYTTEAVKNFYNGETPAVLSLEYLSTDNLKVNTQLEHIYAYPEFTIVNNFDGYIFNDSFTSLVKSKPTMKLKQIEFYTDKETNLLAYKREIKPSDLIKAENWHEDFLLKDEKMSYTSSVTPEVATEYDPAFVDWENDANWVKFEMITGTEKTKLKDDTKKETKRIVVKFDGVELAQGGEHTFHVVMPAEDYTKGGLYARILVEIGEGENAREYYIVTKEVEANGAYNKDLKFNLSTPAGAPNQRTGSVTEFNSGSDYRIADRHQRGSNDIVLVRGQRYPTAEVAVDPVTRAKSVKTFVKENDNHSELLTIELVGGLSQVALAAATPETPETFNGIENNEQLIEEVLANVFTSGGVEETEYNKAPDGDHAKFYFNPEKNTTIIDAELIKAMQIHLGAKNATFTLTQTNLPIAADVLVEVKDEAKGIYTFTAGDYSYDIIYKGVEFGPNKDGKLVAGINKFNGQNNGKLEMAKDEKNAVVFVTGNATVETPVGINGIVMENGTLTVNSTASVAAWIQAEKVILTKGNLTNGMNVLGTVQNNGLYTIAGKTETVTYNTKAGFDTKAIAAETQVNYVTIFVSKENTTLTVTPTSFDFIKNLENVTIVFNENVTGLVSGNESVEGITLTNIKQMVAVNQVEWSTNKDFYGIVNVYCDENADLEEPFYVNITAKDKSVKFIAPEGWEGVLTGNQVFTGEDAQEAAQKGDVTFGDNIDIKVKNGAAITMKEGATIDGNGYTLNSSSHYGVEASAGGTIKNLTIDASSDNDYPNENAYSSRAVHARPLSTDLTIDNCILKGGYSLNIEGTNTHNVTVVKSQLYGWCSWAAAATFTGCDFLMGNYFTADNQENGEEALDYLNGGCAPWMVTTFEDCNFPADWYFDMSKLPKDVKVTFINCTIGGKKLTTEGNFNGYNAEKLIKEGHLEFPAWSTYEKVSDIIKVK